MYPDASEKEWSSKTKPNEEKTLRVVQLKDPDVDPDTMWIASKDDDEEEVEKDNSDGILDMSRWRLDASVMRQAYAYLVEEGPGGVTQQMLGEELGFGKLEARTIFRNLARRDLAVSVMVDKGRQRMTTFVAKKLAHLNTFSKNIESEQKKLKELVSESVKKKPKPKKKTSETENSSFEASDKEMCVEISMGKVGEAIPRSKKGKSSSNVDSMTLIQLRRQTTILREVREHKVIDDPVKLSKIIHEEEHMEGVTTRMDKKSLLRLLVKLAEEGLVKNLIFHMKLGEKMKRLHFICDPTIDENHTVIQSALEQAKMKLNVLTRPSKPLSYPDFDVDSVGKSLQQIQDMSKAEEDSKVDRVVHNPKFIRKYGLKPKFLRLRELHEVLFYLTRGYDGVLRSNMKESLEVIKQQTLSEFDDDLEKELMGMDVYKTKVGWDMFVPPLPNHEVSSQLMILYT